MSGALEGTADPPATADRPAEELVLTAQQRAAVAAPGSVLVGAGAGSGKTAVLVERYVGILCGDAGPALDLDQVLAVTFTEKAAAEMRDRIRTRLGARAAALGGAARARIVRVQRALASARIGTIHALAASLLRGAALESGIRPDATVLDERDGPAWIEGEVRRILLARLRAGDADVQCCADAWGFGGRAGDLVSATVETLTSLGRRASTTAALARGLARHQEAAALAAADVQAQAVRVIAVVEDALAAARPTPAVAVLRERWPEWRAHLDALAAGGRDIETLLALRELPSVAGRALRDREEWRRDGNVLGFKLDDGVPRFAGTLAAAYGCACGVPLAAAFTRVVCAVDDALAAAKRREGVVTFDDLIAGARTLLAEHPLVAARASRDLRAILVDEFQDTDPAQVELLHRLAAGGAELFVVGDDKQSIYRFRGAEVQLFADMRAALGCERDLADNFRSRPAIVAFVNGLAARLFAARADALPWRPRWSSEQRLRARRPAADDGGRPAIRMKSLVNQIRDGERVLLASEARALEARVVAATVAELRDEGWRAGDIAILLPALTQVKAYEFALRRWAIPYTVVRGRGFYDCQEIRDLVHLLVAVADPDDASALAGALRSPLFGLSDETLARLADQSGGLCARFVPAAALDGLPESEAEQVRAARALLIELRSVSDRVGAADVLARALDATHLEGVLAAQFHGAQKIANVRKLVAQARAVERHGFTSVREFGARARRLLETAPPEPEAPSVGGDADVVQVMTIHQAKGLEFPVVILPDLGREPPRDYRAPVVLDPDYGALAIPTFGAGRHRLPHRLVETWRARERERGDAERARLLYVACTRARDVLILCEGKGRRAALASSNGEEGADGDRTACEQIWSFLGRAAIADFVGGSAERVVFSAGGEDGDGARVAVPVEIEKSAALLARKPPPATDVVAGAITRVLETTPSPADVALVASVLDLPRLAATSVVLTPTELADFARCPRQFWYRHVRGIPAALPRVGGRGRDDAVRLGLAAHAVLELLDVDAADRDAAVEAALAGAHRLDAEERRALQRDLVAAVARAQSLDRGHRIVGREVPFCLRLTPGPDVFVRGRIDVLAEREGRLVVRDYKYAHPTDDAEAYRVQLETYALAVAAAYPERAVAAEVEWLRAPGGRADVAIDLDAARARVQRLGDALAAALAARTAAAFPMRYAAPPPCRSIGCAFVARCFDGGAAATRAFRTSAPSATMQGS